MADVTFSPAAPSDFPAVQALLDRCALPTRDLHPSHLEHFILCRAGEHLVGTVGLEPLGDVGLLRSLAVAPELRGRRLGHRLWERACDEARRRGIRHLYLLTTTAEELFSSWGFHREPRDQVPEVVRNTTEYSTMCPSTAAIMVIGLTAERTASDQRVRP